MNPDEPAGPGGERQLPLELPHATSYGTAAYLVGDFNETAQALVRAWPNWPERCLLLVGPEGAGKTHLASVWAELAGAVIVTGAEMSPALHEGVGRGSAVAVEDAEAGDEVLLFHLINIVRERGAWLLVTSRQGPTAHWPHLADLASRLRAMPRAEIFAPDEQVLREVLVKLLGDRQLLVEPSVLDYLAKHLDRSLGMARDLVSELDREALARGRPIGRRLAAEVLARLGGGEPD